MPYYLFLWNDLIERHLAEHGVTADEFEAVVCDPDSLDTSRSSGRQIAFGEANGRFLACVYEMLDESTVLPITAYEVE
jgi:uncharacterized DUF497 family protein